MDTGSRIKLVREHRGLTQQKLGEMLGYGKSSANRIAQYEMGYRSPKANRLKEIAKAMNIREEIFLMPDETPIDLLRILIWYDWEHEGVLQLATSRTANTPPGKTVSPIIYSEQLPLNRLLLDWADQKHSLSVRKITRRLSGMDAAMAATIALKEQTKNRMNFETGYLFCHVETKSFKLWLEALFLCLGF